MDENLDEIPDQDMFSNKNPPFSKEETRTLVDLIDQHKSIIFDKSTNSAANYAKSTAWTNITEAFNVKGLSHARDVDSIKLKWYNIKKKAKRRTNNFTEIDYNEYDDLTARLVAIVAQFETTTDNDDGNNDAANRNCDENQLSKLTRDTNRIPNFTTEECQRLLQCVKAEERNIFCEDTSVQATRLKNNAWTRVSLAFNKGNLHKRSTKVLKAKFENVKRLARGNDKEATVLDRARTDSTVEPNNVKEEGNIDEDYCLLDSQPGNTLIDVPIQMDADNSRSNSPVTAADPLAGVACRYSDVGAKQVNTDVLRPVTQSDIMHLKVQILQCELETAKLKQSQEKQAAASEQTERRLRARLLGLQLREARLNAWTAEQRATQAGATGDILQYRQGEGAVEDMGDRFHS